MKNYQCWLDLQHYEQHLKKLQTIKHRNLSKKPQYSQSKFRSKTVQRDRFVSNRQNSHATSTKKTFLQSEWKNKLKNMQQILEQKQMAKQKIQQQIKSQNFQQIQKQFIIIPLQRDQQFNEQAYLISNLKHSKKNNRFSAGEENKIESNRFTHKALNRSISNQQNFNYFDSRNRRKFQTDHEKENQCQLDIMNQPFKENHNKIKTQIQQCFSVSKVVDRNIQKNNNIKRILTKKSSIEKTNKIRETKLKRFMRFSQLNYVKQLHTYNLELTIISISPMNNSHFLSFWVQAHTIEQKVKSACFTFKQFTQKQINLSFIHRPHGSIQIIIKYFRRLQQFLYGDHLLTICKQNDSQHNFCIRQQHSMNFIEVLAIGKNINKKSIIKKKMSKNINESRFNNYR